MRQKKSLGFTLIEVIVALSIFAALSIIGYKGISSLIQTKQRIAIEDNKWQELLLFFDRFELDIKQCVNRPIRTGDDELVPAWLATPAYSGDDGAQLAFSRFGDPEQPGFLMDTRRVGYRLNEGAVELLIWPSLDVAPAAKPERFKVLSHVAQVTFTYLAEDGRWLTAWPDATLTTAQKSFAPSAVQVKIQLETGETVTRVFAL